MPGVQKPMKPNKAAASKKASPARPQKSTTKPKKAAVNKKKTSAPPADPAATAAANWLAQQPNGAGLVDPISGLTGSVLRDGGELYDVDLAFSDAATNANKFYRLQIVEDGGGAGFHLVQHWGRIGSTGQSQVKALASKAQAIEALEKKFKAKAGFAFSERNTAGAGVDNKYQVQAALDEILKVRTIPNSPSLTFSLFAYLN